MGWRLRWRWWRLHRKPRPEIVSVSCPYCASSMIQIDMDLNKPNVEWYNCGLKIERHAFGEGVVKSQCRMASM